MASNPFDPGHLFGHVQDSDHFEVPKALDFGDGDGKLHLPQPFQSVVDQPIVEGKGIIEPFDLKLTKFMVLEVAAAVVIAVIFVWLASAGETGGSTARKTVEPVRGDVGVHSRSGCPAGDCA